jgi:hypothetical protein
MPLRARSGFESERIHDSGDLAQTLAFLLVCLKKGENLGLSACRMARGLRFPNALFPSRVSELRKRAICLANAKPILFDLLRDLRQARDGALRNHLALVLRHGCHDVKRQLVRLGHVAGHEIRGRLHQARDKGHVARQAVQLRNDQGGLVLLPGPP